MTSGCTDSSLATNKDVNGFWICDEGRYAYHAIDTATRLKSPAQRRGESWQIVSWDDAIRKAAAALKETLEQHGPDAVAVLASPQMTNEELFGTRTLYRDCLKVGNIEFRVPRRGATSSDDFLITADKNPNSRGAEILGLAGKRNRGHPPGMCCGAFDSFTSATTTSRPGTTGK